MMVKCISTDCGSKEINDGHYYRILKDRLYDVIEEGDSMYKIKNDVGWICEYMKSCFIPMKEKSQQYKTGEILIELEQYPQKQFKLTDGAKLLNYLGIKAFNKKGFFHMEDKEFNDVNLNAMTGVLLNGVWEEIDIEYMTFSEAKELGKECEDPHIPFHKDFGFNYGKFSARDFIKEMDKKVWEMGI